MGTDTAHADRPRTSAHPPGALTQERRRRAALADADPLAPTSCDALQPGISETTMLCEAVYAPRRALHALQRRALRATPRARGIYGAGRAPGHGATRLQAARCKGPAGAGGSARGGHGRAL